MRQAALETRPDVSGTWDRAWSPRTFLACPLRPGASQRVASLLDRNSRSAADLRYEHFEAPASVRRSRSADLVDVLSQLGRFEEATEHGEAAGGSPRRRNIRTRCIRVARSRPCPPRAWAKARSATGSSNGTCDLCRSVAVHRPHRSRRGPRCRVRAHRRTDEALPARGREPSRISGESSLLAIWRAACALGWRVSCRPARRGETPGRPALRSSPGQHGPAAHALHLPLTSRPIQTGGGEAAKLTTARRWRSPTALGMRPLVAHCHLGLGKLYRRTGDGRRPRST